MTNAAHLPYKGRFPFKCPFCPFEAASYADVQADDGAGYDTQVHRSSQWHVGQINPIPIRRVIICVLHHGMGCTRHIWGHAIARNIEDDETAADVVNYLYENCDFHLNAKKVKKGMLMEVAQLPSMPNKTTMSVLSHFDVVLSMVLLRAPADHENEVKNATFRSGCAVSSALIGLVNQTRSRPIAQAGAAPGTEQHARARAAAVRKLDLHEEHQGKCMKKWVTLTNQRLYSDEDRAKNGEKKVGFLQQAATRAVVQRHIDTTAPQRASKRQREIEQEGREPKKLVKHEAKGH